MADLPPQFESEDNSGFTTSYSGTATTTVTNITSGSGNIISGVLFSVDGNNIQISFDGGTSFFDMPKKSSGFKNIKGNITVIQIKTSLGSTGYSLAVDYEDN